MRAVMIGFFAAIVAGSLLGGALQAYAADYTPLDCRLARSPSERAICSNYGLGQREARLATLYEWTTSLVAMGQRGDIQDAQRAFIAQRSACRANVTCIQKAYDARIEQLETVMSRIKEKGPF